MFVFAGNRNVRKAGIYVKELCSALWWLHQRQAAGPASTWVANASFVPGPTLAEYVEAVRKVGGYRFVAPTVPAWLLLLASRVLFSLGRPLGLFGALRPERVRKTLRSNNVLARRLMEEGYAFRYGVATALEDWRADCQADW